MNYQNKCTLLARHLYIAPSPSEATIMMFLHHVSSRERLYSDNPWTYTIGREVVEDCQLLVGDFPSEGLSISPNIYEDPLHGVAGLRKF